MVKQLVTTIRINEADKLRFDKLKRTLTFMQNKEVSQEEVTATLLDTYEHVNAEVKTN